MSKLSSPKVSATESFFITIVNMGTDKLGSDFSFRCDCHNELLLFKTNIYTNVLSAREKCCRKHIVFFNSQLFKSDERSRNRKHDEISRLSAFEIRKLYFNRAFSLTEPDLDNELKQQCINHISRAALYFFPKPLLI